MGGIQLVRGLLIVIECDESALPGELVVAFLTLLRELPVMHILMALRTFSIGQEEFGLRIGVLVTLVAAHLLMLSQQFVFGVTAMRIYQRPPGPASGCMTALTILAKRVWVRIFVAVCTCAEFHSDISGSRRFSLLLPPVAFDAFDFRMFPGQGVICQSMVEGIGIQTNDIHIRTLVIGMTVLAVSLEFAVITVPFRESLFHRFMTIQAERIVYPLRQRMARIAILEFLLSRVRSCKLSGRKELRKG